MCYFIKLINSLWFGATLNSRVTPASVIASKWAPLPTSSGVYKGMHSSYLLPHFKNFVNSHFVCLKYLSFYKFPTHPFFFFPYIFSMTSMQIVLEHPKRTLHPQPGYNVSPSSSDASGLASLLHLGPSSVLYVCCHWQIISYVKVSPWAI